MAFNETGVLFPLCLPNGICICVWSGRLNDVHCAPPSSHLVRSALLRSLLLFLLQLLLFFLKIIRWACVFSAALFHIPHSFCSRNQMSCVDVSLIWSFVECMVRFGLVWFGMQCSQYLLVFCRTPHQISIILKRWNGRSRILFCQGWVPSARFCTWFTINREKNPHRILHNGRGKRRKVRFPAFYSLVVWARLTTFSISIDWVFFLEKKHRLLHIPHCCVPGADNCWPIHPSILRFLVLVAVAVAGECNANIILTIETTLSKLMIGIKCE